MQNRDKSKRPSQGSNGVNSYFIGPGDEEPPEITCKDCLCYWAFNFLVNGMFTTSRIVGYAQFMVFMILRVIITGSLCGRLYGDDPRTINCSFVYIDDVKRRSVSSSIHPVDLNTTVIDILSDDVRETCLSIAYWNISPITLWALSLLTVVLPWLLLLPWTPLRDDQDYFLCKPTSVQWPCLTIYVVRFMKACIRLVLEFMCMIAVPVIYGGGIDYTVECFQKNVACDIHDAKEKTYFLWLFAAVNLLSCCLTVWELVDICQNKHFYETDRRGYASSSKLSSNRSSTATMNTTASHFIYNNDRSDSNRRRKMTANIVTRPDSKRRVGKTRYPDAEDREYRGQVRSKGKFKATMFRQADGDEVIKLAATTDDAKNCSNSPATPQTNVSAEALANAVNNILLHEAPIVNDSHNGSSSKLENC